MSDSFEFHAKADEWMDVTPKEEVLASELKRLKEAFEKVSEQLDACRLENDLLKDHKEALEHNYEQLEVALEVTKEAVDRTSVELAESKRQTSNVQKAAVDREASLQSTIAEKELEVNQAKAEIGSLQQTQQRLDQEYEAAALKSSKLRDDLVQENKALQEKMASIQQDNREQHETIARFYREVETSRANETRLQLSVDNKDRELETLKKEATEARKTTGTIATLAEDLKTKKVTLERLLSKKEQAIATVQDKEADATAQVSALQKRLEDVETSSASRMQYLEGCLEDQTRSLEQSQGDCVSMEIQLADLKSKNSTLEQECQDLRDHLMKMESVRHEWLEQKSEMDESLDETFSDLESANERLHQLEEALEAAELERASLESHREKYMQAATREAALYQKMREQQLSFEHRLQEIRSILGLKFTAAIHAEVQVLKNELPISFRVPLLAAKH